MTRIIMIFTYVKAKSILLLNTEDVRIRTYVLIDKIEGAMCIFPEIAQRAKCVLKLFH